jgi:hypothetical protein
MHVVVEQIQMVEKVEEIGVQERMTTILLVVVSKEEQDKKNHGFIKIRMETHKVHFLMLKCMSGSKLVISQQIYQFEKA